MKNLLSIVFIMVLLSITFFVKDNNEKVVVEENTFTLELATKTNITPVKSILPLKVKSKTFEMFIDSLAFKESSNRYHIINQLGYKGRYQFGGMVLKDLGIYDRKDFIENHRLQDKAFVSLLSINKYRLRNEIKKYTGKYVNGVYITESGILSAAHLVGSGAVKKFLKRNKLTKDANGVSVIDYLQKFSGYEINVEAKRKINLSNFK